MIDPISSGTRTLPFLLVALMAAGACADAVSDPMAALMAQETRAALDFGGAVPSLADVWVDYLHGTRRYLMRRFPYLVVYRATPDKLQVIAVAHGKRKPGYWRNRLKGPQRPAS